MAKVKSAVKELIEVLEAATFETAHFGTDENTAKIKQDTKLYRQTWIISPLIKALRDLGVSLDEIEAILPQK